MIIYDPNSPEAQAMLAAPVIVFDIETNTAKRHWDSDKRGLSYGTEVTDVAFYDGLNTLVLTAEVIPDQEFPVEIFSRTGQVFSVEEQFIRDTDYVFTPDQQTFIRAMFSRTDPVTYVAHNLIFDARQVFGKFDLPVLDNMRFWDTQTVEVLRNFQNPLVEQYDDEDVDDYEVNVIQKGGNDLLSTYERVVGRIGAPFKAFLKYMKGQRKQFPNIDLGLLLSNVEALQYIGTEAFQPYKELLMVFMSYKDWDHALLRTKQDIRYAASAQYLFGENLLPIVVGAADLDSEIIDIHQALLNGESLANVRHQHQTKSAFSKVLKALTVSVELALEDLVRQLLDEYSEFDVTAPWEIYQVQSQPIDGYKRYLELVEWDVEYQSWCVEIAARGYRLDRQYLVEKINGVYAEYARLIQSVGLSLDEWDVPAKDGWTEDMMFWGGRFYQEWKVYVDTPEFDVDGKPIKKQTIAQYIDRRIQETLRSGEDPVTPYPTVEQMRAQLDVLCKGTARAAIKNGKTPVRSDLSFGKKSIAMMVDMNPDLKAVKIAGRIGQLKTIASNWEALLRDSEFDGRIHTLLARRTVTGRNSSSSPNLQNLHFDADGKDPLTDMAGVLVADPGYVAIELDYSNAENFTAAMLSGDQGLATACCATDFHSMKAALIFGDRWTNADPDTRKLLRKYSKAITFGTSYGMGAAKLATSLSITLEEAKQLLDLNDNSYPDMAYAKEMSKLEAEQNGYVSLWSGRRVRIRSRINPKTGKEEIKSYAGWNSKNQGAVAEIIVRAIVKVRRWLRAHGLMTWVGLQVHDSLVVLLALEEASKLIDGKTVVQHIIEVMATVLDETMVKIDGVPTPINLTTTPAIRWLADLDNAGNAKKWGFVSGQTYPLPLDEYVNRWGIWKLTEEEIKQGKAPTWINQYGHGQEALDVELGQAQAALGLPAAPATVVHEGEGFGRWPTIKRLTDELAAYVGPRTIDGRVLDFPTAMLIMQRRWEQGVDDDYKRTTDAFMELAAVLNELKAHMQS